MTIHSFPSLPMTEFEARIVLTSPDAGQSSQLRRLAWATLRVMRASRPTGTGIAGLPVDLATSCGRGTPHPDAPLTDGSADTHGTGPVRPLFRNMFTGKETR